MRPIQHLLDRLEEAARLGDSEIVAKSIRDLHRLDVNDERSLRIRRSAILALGRMSEQRLLRMGGQPLLSGPLSSPAGLAPQVASLIEETRRLDRPVPDALAAQFIAAVEQAISESRSRSARLFISYRRSDAGDAVARLTERLTAAFGSGAVFRDIDSIPIGGDYRSHLVSAVSRAGACLVIIGPHWLDTRNAEGGRRLDDPEDWVRVEIETAFRVNRGLIIPTLIGETPMPEPQSLPASIADLPFREGQRLRPDPDFHHDCDRLIARLRAGLDRQS